MELSRTIEYTVDSGLAIITLQRDEARNALDPDTIDSLTASVRDAYFDQQVRALLIRSRGDAFCSGMDLGKLASEANPDPLLLGRAIQAFSDLLRLIMTGPKVVIAAVTGDLLAGGVGLAGACDIVLALDHIGVQLGEIIFGLIPANIMAPLVQRRISAGTYRRWALLGERISAEEALAAGYFDGVYENRDILEKEIRNVIKRCYRASPPAVARLKSIVDSALSASLSRGKYARETLYDLATDQGTLAAIRALADGDTPDWFERFKPENPLLLDELQER